jgi:hypothetical protein
VAINVCDGAPPHHESPGAPGRRTKPTGAVPGCQLSRQLQACALQKPSWPNRQQLGAVEGQSVGNEQRTTPPAKPHIDCDTHWVAPPMMLRQQMLPPVQPALLMQARLAPPGQVCEASMHIVPVDWTQQTWVPGAQLI